MSVLIRAPIDRVWRALLDLPPLARPGSSVGVDGFRGRIGDHAGVVRLEEADDDEHVARFRATALDGAWVATITARLAADGDSTRVHVDTDALGGRPQLAGDVRDRFAEGLARELRDEPAAAEPLDLAADVAGPLAERGLAVMAGMALGFAAGWLARGRR